MFNRRHSQRPTDQMLCDFQKKFPHVSPYTSNSADSASQSEPNEPPRPMEGELKEEGEIEPWTFTGSGLTPSLMDPNSQQFNIFANHLGYYTPTPGGSTTHYRSQAGDLHGSNFATGLNTPLSLPTSGAQMHAPFSNLNFHMHHQTGFAPQHFSHQNFDGMDGALDHQTPDNAMHQSPPENMAIDMVPMRNSPNAHYHQSSQPAMQPVAYHPSGDKFRFHATLSAPTAMVKHADEIPVTYLNKGQTYNLHVVDTQASGAPGKYRTFVRVSFEDEQQRQKPAACWQLWKEGRGSNEAHHRGGRLQAVEYVEGGANNTNSGTDEFGRPPIEVESTSFDGFCVVWSASAGVAESWIPVRFNFLSTDFSHSKGVKGIPVRLCAKTERLGEPGTQEVCYGKVKLFRDHGAERKLSNDIAHVKKTIEKLNHQIAQIESGVRELGKRKRGSASLGKNGQTCPEERPGKIAKQRRTWSVTSVTSNGCRGSAEEDLHMKLMALQDMFTSTKPASVLYLRGEEQDDPDLFPVRLAMGRAESAPEGSTWEGAGGPPSSLVSPTPSPTSMGRGRRGSTAPAAAPQQLASPPEQTVIKVQTHSPHSGRVTGCIEAVGIDTSYRAPERPDKAAACIYVRPQTSGHYYRAVYLHQRNLGEFIRAVTDKCDYDAAKVQRVVRTSANGLPILFDEDCVKEMAEGQDMTVSFTDAESGGCEMQICF
ncbi:hypothetical protein K470DRAFT_256160 [Piedraia hortae CBS 480.64]|uniref:Grh/CP2 DB domain-containing protein n=1 Tax=Piedraia hortae CBS 480.64 TaxID=1314780 RepID=A0A6A7C3Z2_9PEZI|nr:hypothetical protein K470DRAFT_256160 [Piedraia hortae CBS 480.64]